MAKRIRHLFEYAGLRLIILLIDHISLAASTRLVCGLAGLWFRTNRTKRQISINNILRSGITSDRAEARRIALASFRHFATLILESMRSDMHFTESNWRDKIDLHVDPQSMALLRKPEQGVILVSGHLGNWEIAAQLISFIKPVVGITRRMNNPWVDKLIQERKPRNRFTLTPKHDADMGRLMKTLKNGNVLALLTDQFAKSTGMMVDFFGIPASTHTSAALLHLITKAPICFGYCLRLGPMHYRLVAGPPIIHRPTGKRTEDVREILEEINHRLESAVRDTPEQYLWGHRRWRDTSGADTTTIS